MVRAQTEQLVKDECLVLFTGFNLETYVVCAPQAMYENTMKRRFKAAFLVLSVTVISFMFWSFTASSHWVWPMVGPNNTPSRYGELKGRETLLETQAGQGHSCYPGLFEPTSDCGQVHRSAESKSGQRPVQHLFFLKVGLVLLKEEIK